MLTVLLLIGCGGDYCERLADTVSECDGSEPSEADLERCHEQLEPCSGSDQDALEDSLDCSIDAGLYACDEADPAPGAMSTTAPETEDFDDLYLCYLPLAGLSPECRASVGVVGMPTTESF